MLILETCHHGFFPYLHGFLVGMFLIRSSAKYSLVYILTRVHFLRVQSENGDGYEGKEGGEILEGSDLLELLKEVVEGEEVVEENRGMLQLLHFKRGRGIYKYIM